MLECNRCTLTLFFHSTVTPVVQFPHDVIATVSIAPAATSNQVNNEVVIPVELDPPNPEEAAGQDEVEASTSNLQVPLTDPSSVASSGMKRKEKVKGRIAKKARHDEKVKTTNTAVLYLDLENEENAPVSSSGIPAYLLKPAPTTLGLDELCKHGIIADIEKNRALTRAAEKFMTLVP